MNWCLPRFVRCEAIHIKIKGCVLVVVFNEFNGGAEQSRGGPRLPLDVQVGRSQYGRGYVLDSRDSERSVQDRHARRRGICLRLVREQTATVGTRV